MTVEEAQAALDEAQKAFDAAKGTGVSKVAAASKALSAAKRALETAQKAETAGINVGGISRAEQLAALRQTSYAAAQEEAGKSNKPTVPPPTATERFDYVWRPEPGGRGGYWSLVSYPIFPSTTKIVTTDSTDSTDTTGYKVVNGILLFNGQPFSGTYNGQTYENGKVKTTDSTDTTGYRVVNGILLFNGQPFSGTYEGKTYENGKLKVVTDGSNNDTPTGLDAATLELIKSLQDQIAALTTKNNQAAIDKAAAEAAAKQEKAENAIAVLTDRFTRYGLASLVPRIKQLAISGASESTITLQLQESEEYKTRFKANEDRIKKGLRVLDPSDYLNLEDDYRQILRAYGLKAFDTDAYVQQFIANDIATTELSNRVVTAVQRVQNADPAVLTTLRSFYGISDNDLVAYVLDPNQQFQKIERQVAAAEIGAAAGLQGISTGVSVAEQLATQGITKAQAQKGYATIADILPTAEKLSGIYDKALPSYGLAEAEQEVFNTLASAQRKRRALAEREIAEFSGASGLSKSALSKQLGGTY